MATWSKIYSGVNCTDISHSWTDNCLLAGLEAFVKSCIGSTGFFFALHLFQYLSTVVKNKRKASLYELLRNLLRSTIFGACITTTIFSTSCLLRKLLGRYYYYSTVLIPTFLGSCSIFLESKKARELYCNAFANCILELWIRQLEYNKLLNWTPTSQTVTFMLLSSLLSSLLSRSSSGGRYFWFFRPPKVDKKTNDVDVCFHSGDCWKHLIKLFIMYSSTGLALQCIRVIMANMKTPNTIIYSLIQPKTFKLAAFLGGYVVIYQALRCFLYQRERKYSPEHDSIAGFVAGSAFRFQPNITILNTAIMTIIQVLTEIGCRRKIFPDIPYTELVFIVSCSLLFHMRIYFSELCPKEMVYIMSKITHGKSDDITETYKNILKDYYLKNTP